MNKKLYRPNVAAMIINNKKEILICQRIDNGAWQLPQGGVDSGESDITALFREIREETGISKIRAVAKSNRKYRYKFPETMERRDEYIGQEQSYYLLHYEGNGNDIKLDQREFQNFDWVAVNKFLDKIENVRVKNYRQALDEFHDIIENLQL